MYKVLLCLFFLCGCIKQDVPNVLTEKTRPDEESTAELTVDELQQRQNKPFGEYCASCRRLHPEYYNRFTDETLDPNL